MSIDFNANIPETPVQAISHPLLKKHNITLLIKRDDLTHPLISGNKWRKLKYNLAYSKQHNIPSLVSFSGPFSNHLYALAGATRLFGLSTKVIIRGPELDPHNPCLKFARACGVELIPVTRKEYRLRNEKEYLERLSKRYPNTLVIPEGGSNQLALKGVVELAQSLPQCDEVWCAVGSSGTLAGLIEGLPETTAVKGVAVLKQADYLNNAVMELSNKAQHQTNWKLLTDFHGGGYGKFPPELWQFCREMKSQVPLEPIYTGKLLYSIFQLIEAGHFKAKTNITAIHTGGLQGLTGLKYRGLI